MYYGISVLIGFMIALMIQVNGELTNVYGLYTAAAIIHIIGLVLVYIMIIKKKQTIFQKAGIPLWMYLGGVVGAWTTVFNNVAFEKIGVAKILALSLFGQIAASLLIDQFGLLGMKKVMVNRKKLCGIIGALAGILIMIFPVMEGTIVPIAASLLSGVTIVVSKTFNSGMSEKTDPMISTFYNFLTGFVMCVFLIFIIGRKEPLFAGNIEIPFGILMYTGGILGIGVVFLQNLVVSKISAFHMTLFVFIGQVGTGILIDCIKEGNINKKVLIGCVLVGIGLLSNFYLDSKAE